MLSSPGSVDELFDNGTKVESLPKSVDYLSTVAKVNQIISAEIVRGYVANYLSIEDSNQDKHSSFNTAHNSNNAKL